MKKLFFLIVGNISLVLGIAGIFLPLLPTTPFLLLSAACYLRSSDKLYHWLVNHRLFGPYIKSYIIYSAISLKAKIISVALLWIVFSVTIVFFIHTLWFRLSLLIIPVGVTVFILSRKTLTKEMLMELEQDNR